MPFRIILIFLLITTTSFLKAQSAKPEHITSRQLKGTYICTSHEITLSFGRFHRYQWLSHYQAAEYHALDAKWKIKKDTVYVITEYQAWLKKLVLRNGNLYPVEDTLCFKKSKKN